MIAKAFLRACHSASAMGRNDTFRILKGRIFHIHTATFHPSPQRCQSDGDKLQKGVLVDNYKENEGRNENGKEWKHDFRGGGVPLQLETNESDETLTNALNVFRDTDRTHISLFLKEQSWLKWLVE